MADSKTTTKPILLATDMTARCDRAFDRALMLAKIWGTRLIVVHVLDPKQAKKKGLVPKEARTQLEDELPETDVDVQFIIEMGNIGELVIETAKRERCGLIVTGVAHYDGFSDVFLGSPVDHIVRHAHVPVLIIKRKPINPYGNILVATDFSDCSMTALNTAAELFPEVPLHLVHAYNVPYSGWLKSDQVAKDIGSEEAKSMERFLAQTTINNAAFKGLVTSSEKGELGVVLFNKIKEVKSDLVVLGTHGKSGFMRASMGNNARVLLGWLKQDVMMVRDPQ
ncbi:universal stress protein [Parasphingorhabdus cellanae]|uniref:Universal stress protein n=1 Tax=Parasphingorhabdus cellanae TaxID=2806553 RepID=A0ABX7T4W2_9SPHN|nr:universal stress protein [Parasphingorhabdus cellanae]QTD55792.1 universal stress protein [Parasphingorhabdus cellanae]